MSVVEHNGFVIRVRELPHIDKDGQWSRALVYCFRQQTIVRKTHIFASSKPEHNFHGDQGRSRRVKEKSMIGDLGDQKL